MQYKSRWARGLAALGMVAALHAPAYAQGVATKDSGTDGPDGRQYRVIAIHANGNSSGQKPLIVLDRLDDGVRIEPFLPSWQYTELAASAAPAVKGYAAEKIMDRGSLIGYVLEPQDSPNGKIRYYFDRSRNGKVIMRVSEESLTQSGGAGGAGGGAGGAGGAGGGGAR